MTDVKIILDDSSTAVYFNTIWVNNHSFIVKVPVLYQKIENTERIINKLSIFRKYLREQLRQRLQFVSKADKKSPVINREV